MSGIKDLAHIACEPAIATLSGGGGRLLARLRQAEMNPPLLKPRQPVPAHSSAW